jgi:hypothetical protein
MTLQDSFFKTISLFLNPLFLGLLLLNAILFSCLTVGNAVVISLTLNTMFLILFNFKGKYNFKKTILFFLEERLLLLLYPVLLILFFYFFDINTLNTPLESTYLDLFISSCAIVISYLVINYFVHNDSSGFGLLKLIISKYKKLLILSFIILGLFFISSHWFVLVFTQIFTYFYVTYNEQFTENEFNIKPINFSRLEE